jgi:hypothetical protein
MQNTRQLTENEKRVLAAGLAHMQPPLPAFRKADPGLFHTLVGFIWAAALGFLGWLLVGLAVLGVVGLLGVFAL